MDRPMTEHVRKGVIDIDGAEFEGIIEALESIGTGRFSWDHHEHCANAVEHAIAVRDSVVPVLRKSLVLDNTPEAREKMADDIMVPVLDWGSEYCDSEAVPDVEAAIERILTTLLGPPVEPEP
jgi:hypothetical protein